MASNLVALAVLEGEYVTAQDAKDISQRAPFYAAVYALASLYLGLLFNVAPSALRERAELVRLNQNGGTGTILSTFCPILLSITGLVLDDETDIPALESTYRWLGALPHSKPFFRALLSVFSLLFPLDEDFRAVVRMLKALEKIKSSRVSEIPWSDASELVEEALEALEHARSYLFAGKSWLAFIKFNLTNILAFHRPFMLASSRRSQVKTIHIAYPPELPAPCSISIQSLRGYKPCLIHRRPLERASPLGDAVGEGGTGGQLRDLDDCPE